MLVMFHNVPIWAWLLIAVVFIAAVVIVFMLVRKQSAGIAQQKAELSEEAKETLKSAKLYPAAGGRSSEWIQLAMLSVMTAKGKNYHCKLLFYNTRLPGNRLNDFEYAESKISIEDAERYGLKAGSLVFLHIMPEQCKAVILPEFRPEENA